MARMGINDQGVITFTADEAIAQYQRVKLAASQTAQPANVDIAGAGEQHVGYADAPAASGELVAVRLRNANGTRLAIAAGAVVAGVAIYGAAAGEVDDAISGTTIGMSLQAAAAQGDVIAILDDNGGL